MNKKPLKVAVVGGIGAGRAALIEALGKSGIVEMPNLDEKRAQINKVLDDAEAALQALGCKYFLAALDRDVRDTEGGKVFINSEHNGADMSIIMQHAFPANKDLIHLGITVGNEIMRRNKEANISFREKKRKPAKKSKSAETGLGTAIKPVMCDGCKQWSGVCECPLPQ